MAESVALVQFASDLSGSGYSARLIGSGLRESGYDVQVAFGHDGPMARSFRSSGLGTTLVEHRNPFRTTRTSAFVRNVFAERRRASKFEHWFRQINPAVVYLNTSVSYAAAIAARRMGLPLIWHLRELGCEVGGELAYPGFFRWWIRRQFVKLSSLIVANSKAVASNLLPDSYHAEIIPNAVEDRFFIDDLTARRSTARTQFKIPPGAKVIGLPGTLRPMKGHKFCFEALEELLASSPDHFLIVSGDTKHPFAQDVLEFAGRLSSSGNIRFLGSQNDMVPFYAACDVICVPSSSEPFGRTIIESMAVGVPVVATRVGGIPEIIDDRSNGILIEYGDREKLCYAVKFLLNDGVTARQLATAARVKAEQKYHESQYHAQVVNVVSRVLNEARIAGA